MPLQANSPEAEAALKRVLSSAKERIQARLEDQEAQNDLSLLMDTYLKHGDTTHFVLVEDDEEE